MAMNYYMAIIKESGIMHFTLSILPISISEEWSQNLVQEFLTVTVTSHSILTFKGWSRLHKATLPLPYKAHT